jgi:hypothetical protein
LTVTGTFLNASDAPRVNTPVQFLPESNPQVDSLGVITAVVVKTLTNNLGKISIVLDQGIYLVVVGHEARDKFRIAVPDSDATADITTLFVVAAPTSPVYVPAWYLPASGGNYQYNAGKFQLKNLDTGLFHTVWVVGQPNAEQLQTDQPGEGPIVVTGLVPQAGNNYRLKAGNLQFRNLDTGLYHTLHIVGAPGFEMTQIATGEA